MIPLDVQYKHSKLNILFVDEILHQIDFEASIQGLETCSGPVPMDKQCQSFFLKHGTLPIVSAIVDKHKTFHSEEDFHRWIEIHSKL